MSFYVPCLALIVTLIVFRTLKPNGPDRSLDTCKSSHGLMKKQLIRQHLHFKAKKCKFLKIYILNAFSAIAKHCQALSIK